MVTLNIGDTVELKGIEVKIYAIKFHYSAEGVSASIDLVDPFISDRWKSEAEAKKKQTELLGSGKYNKVVNEMVKDIKDEAG
jgi:hypothetical protein